MLLSRSNVKNYKSMESVSLTHLCSPSAQFFMPHQRARRVESAFPDGCLVLSALFIEHSTFLHQFERILDFWTLYSVPRSVCPFIRQHHWEPRAGSSSFKPRKMSTAFLFLTLFWTSVPLLFLDCILILIIIFFIVTSAVDTIISILWIKKMRNREVEETC